MSPELGFSAELIQKATTPIDRTVEVEPGYVVDLIKTHIISTGVCQRIRPGLVPGLAEISRSLDRKATSFPTEERKLRSDFYLFNQKFNTYWLFWP